MELRELNYLSSIYETRSFTKAAQIHYISQPNITTAIKKLEEELGCTLIDRQARPLRFTEEGEFFMPFVKNILSAVNEAKVSLDYHLNHRRQKINVCISSSIGNGLLPLLYTDFVQRYPEIDIMTYDMTMDMILESLWKEELDIAYTIIPEEVNLTKYQVTLLQNSELCLLIHKENPLAQEERISFERLTEERVLTFPEGSLILDQLRHRSSSENVALNLQKITQIYIMEKLVKTNYGVATVIRNTFNKNAVYKDYVVKSFENPIFFKEGFIIKKGRRLLRQHDIFQSYIMDRIEM